MTVYKPIKAEAEAAAAAAIALLNGEDVEDVEGDWEVQSINNGEADLPYVALEPIAVTKDNIADTVIADGSARGTRSARASSSSTAPRTATERTGAGAPTDTPAQPR